MPSSFIKLSTLNLQALYAILFWGQHIVFIRYLKWYKQGGRILKLLQARWRSYHNTSHNSELLLFESSSADSLAEEWISWSALMWLCRAELPVSSLPRKDMKCCSSALVHRSRRGTQASTKTKKKLDHAKSHFWSIREHFSPIIFLSTERKGNILLKSVFERIILDKLICRELPSKYKSCWFPLLYTSKGWPKSYWKGAWSSWPHRLRMGLIPARNMD